MRRRFGSDSFVGSSSSSGGEEEEEEEDDDCDCVFDDSGATVAK